LRNGMVAAVPGPTNRDTDILTWNAT
jgi:hypothetical protein